MIDMERYRRDGFVVRRGLLDADVLRRFERRFVDLALGRTPRAAHMVIMQDVMVAKGRVQPESPLHGVNKLLSFENDAVLFGYALSKPLLEGVREIVGPDVMTISTNVFNKPPGVDGRHPLHQDLRYFSLRPADGIVGTWTAIDPARRESGCLVVVPGSHTGELLRHGSPDWEHVNFGFFAADGVDLEARVHVEMEPGDTLFFHPLLVHGSGRNRSKGFRRAISAHFAATSCRRPDRPRKREAVMRRIPAPHEETR